MIDLDVPLLSHDHRRLLLRDVAGEHGLIVVGMSRSGERGFQMLYRFAGACERLEAGGVHVAFVYPKAAARHVQDPLSVMAARYRQRACLLLDDSGRFFGGTLPARSLSAVRFDAGLARVETLAVALQDDAWDAVLGAFLMRAVADAAC